jgi:AraC-like DNA-binding protein
MSVIEKFATANVAPHERLEYWNRLTSETYPGTSVDHPIASFEAEMLRWTLGDLTMIRPRSQASIVSRRPTGNDPERIVLHLQHRGHSRHEQWGRTAEMSVGDFSLCSAWSPYKLDLDLHELLVVDMPREALEQRVPMLDDVISRRLSGSSASGQLLHNFLLSLWQQGDQSHADADWQAGVANVFLDLLGLAVRGADLPAAEPQAVRERMLRTIEAGLGDPELGTAMLAADLRVSMRTIQNVFAGMGTTPSAYILERRLIHASEQLSVNPAQSITALAFELGFNDSAYFTRCFRHRFGTTPSACRAGRNTLQ